MVSLFIIVFIELLEAIRAMIKSIKYVTTQSIHSFFIINKLIIANPIEKMKAIDPRAIIYEFGFLKTSKNFKNFMFLSLSTIVKNKTIM
mgnify:CR=1 FL=1